MIADSEGLNIIGAMFCTRDDKKASALRYIHTRGLTEAQA